MSRKSRSRIKDSIQPPRQLPAARADLVQSRCACGASAGVTGQCSSCAQKKMAAEHRRADETGHAAAAPPIVSDVLRTSGEQLDPETRASMESHFGHDFSDVRVHNDSQARESARAVDARAYTVGRTSAFATRSSTAWRNYPSAQRS